MITIKKDSWHYKLLDGFHIQPSKSLCTYFWQVVLLSLYVVVMTSGVLFVVCCYLYFTAAMVLFHWYPELTVTAIGGAILNILVLSACLIVTVVDRRREERLSSLARLIRQRSQGVYEEEEPKQPSLLSQWIKAKKEKICPIIEFE